jgi:hypothetical protein
MKKYPVTYKGQLYEVRWKDAGWFPAIMIYKQITLKFLKLKIYKQIYYEHTCDINKHIAIQKSNPNYYIEQIKELFRLYEEDIKQTEIESIKQQTLSNWDGIL